MAAQPQLVRQLHVAQVQGSVVDDMENAPADGGYPTQCFSRVPSRSDTLRAPKDLPRLSLSSLQELGQRRGIVSFRDELSIPIPCWGTTTHHFAHPKVLCTSDMSRQDGKGVGGMLLDALQGAPVQRLRGQIRDQLADLAPKIFNHLQVALQFWKPS